MGFLRIFLISFFIVLVSCEGKSDNRLTIAVASNMQYAITEITSEFEKTTGIECDLIIGSSGKLTSQIMEGAPYDIFLSADMKYPNLLFKEGKTIDSPRVYGYGHLVLYALEENDSIQLSSLNKTEVRHIALANPKNAPYGKAAIEVLENYELLDSLKGKLVYGESISQTNQFLQTEAAQIGFTAKASALKMSVSGKGNWVELDPNTYTPIAQGLVLLKHNDGTRQSAEEFYSFIFSEEAQDILQNYGYSIDE